MQRVTLLGVLAAVGTSGASANIINNGDFEHTIAPNSLFNLTNVDFGSYMQNAVAFGAASELEIIERADYGVAAPSGLWKVGMHQRPIIGADAFSLSLTVPVTAGSTYSLSFYTAGLVSEIGPMPLGPVEIGLSSNASGFGTMIFSGAAESRSQWTHCTLDFVAPVDATFITVRTSASVPDMYAFVDNVTLDVPCPGTLSVAGFLVLSRRRRNSFAAR
jgi:hypothetical protein